MSLVTARSESCCNSAWAEDMGSQEFCGSWDFWWVNDGYNVDMCYDICWCFFFRMWMEFGSWMEFPWNAHVFFLRVYIWDLNGFDGILMKKHVQSPYQLECMCINLGRNSESWEQEVDIWEKPPVIDFVLQHWNHVPFPSGIHIQEEKMEHRPLGLPTNLDSSTFPGDVYRRSCYHRVMIDVELYLCPLTRG